MDDDGGYSKFIDYMKDHKICIRFIEQMPLGNKKTTIALTRNEIRKNLKDQGIRFHKTEQRMGNGPAVYETMEGYKGMIGWIEALHGKFCDTCNRIRLTSIGGIKPCLYYEEAGNLRDLLRKAETSDEEIKQVLKEIIYKNHRHIILKKCRQTARCIQLEDKINGRIFTF